MQITKNTNRGGCIATFPCLEINITLIKVVECVDVKGNEYGKKGRWKHTIYSRHFELISH